MRLKCIKLAGFKSFVDPTTIHFPRNMSAIVGPNGCGKSNVIDAVRWVMGESSAKTLRGESMSDVIFSGSTARKPLGQASIELVFDNSEGSLGGEYAGFSEIAIKRKVTREGQSEYFLNGSKCRRRDITDIFLGTGLGPRSYAIIEQGMISRLIEAKPEELRVYIEEAAGISKYKERRRDTENRMRRTRENLERLTDIREELDRQLDRLKRQASAAEKYKEFKREERLLKGQLKAIQWRDLDREAGRHGQTIAEREVAVEEVVSRQQALDTRLEKLRVDNAEKSEAHNAIQGRFYALGEEIARLEQAIRFQQERHRQLNEELGQTERSYQDTLRHLEEDRRKITEWTQELDELEPQLEAAQGVEAASLQALQDAEAAMQGWQQRWDAFNDEAAAARREAEVLQSRIQHVEQGLERLDRRTQGLEHESRQLSADPMVQELDGLRERLTALEGEGQQTHERIEALHARLDEQQSALAEKAGGLEAVRTRFREDKGRLSSLEALQQAAFAEDDEQVQAWLADQGLIDAPRLGERVTVEPGWEAAAEMVLGTVLGAVCVDSLPEPVRALGELPARLALYAPSAADASDTSDTDSLASRVRGAEGLSAFLGRVRLADTLEDALAIQPTLGADESVITSDGVWLGRCWSRVDHSEANQAGVLARTREIETLRERVAADEKTIADGEAEVAALRERQGLLESERQQAEQALRENSRQQGQVRADISAREARLEQMSQRQKGVTRELEECREQATAEQAQLAEARAALEQAIQAMSDNEARRETLLSERDTARRTLDEIRQKTRHEKDATHQIAARVQALRAQRDSLTTGIERMESRLGNLSEREEQLRLNLAENDNPVEDLQKQLDELLQKRLTVEEELTASRQALSELDHAVRESEQERHRIEQALSDKRSHLEQARLEAQTLDVRRRGLEEQLLESDHDLDALLESLPEDASAEQWQADVTRIGERIQRLGAINLAAIDEYRTQSERKVYLDRQDEDLVAALTTLENAIRKIDRETRNRFKETFDRLNQGLQELFPKVFGGGRASLDMTGDDLLDTGVAIMANPPGKKNASIHMLSGGEKALTAIALVFSIFRLNPAPFCMLDEVDAPLDDVNTSRYARMVQEMSSQVQFIYITHNKISMEMADHLMGVTMHEPGVSRMVSVDIDEAAELATA